MKSTTLKALFIFLMLPLFAAWGQDASYYVVHVKGDIQVKKTGQKLKIGDQLSTSEELRFMTADAKAVVMHTKEGRMLIDGAKSKKNADGEFISFVRDVMLPGKDNIRLSTRGAFDYDVNYKSVNNFQKFFGNDRYVFIGDALTLGIDLTKYPVSETKRLIYRYETPERPVNKKLPYEGNNVMFNRETLYKTKGTQVDPNEAQKVDLLYFDFNTNEAVPLTTFKPIFVDEKTLLLELKSVASFLQNNQVMEQNKIKEELFDFILEVHGPINRNVFYDWLNSKELLTKR